MTQTTNKNTDLIVTNDHSRRNFLKSVAHLGLFSLVASPSLLIPRVVQAPGLPEGFIPPASPTIAKTPELALSLYNTHTGEALKKHIFWAEGQFVEEQLQAVNKLFRDHRTNELHPIDPELLKLLANITDLLESQDSIHLISGYRSPKTNKMLAKNSGGVATKSQHLCGKAADIMLPGRPLKQIQKAAKSLKIGGVGRYSTFVHVDTGRVRSWGMA
jgi:uncharacterized protein YcbK (DUF882 family)